MFPNEIRVDYHEEDSNEIETSEPDFFDQNVEEHDGLTEQAEP